MTALSTSNYGILSGLASKLGLRAVWSQASGEAGSDVNDWLAYALSDAAQTPQLVALREEIRALVGSTVPMTAKTLFEYYRGLLDGGLAPFPPTVTPLAWLRGHDAPAFQDLGGTTPATAVGSVVQRVNNVAPLTGFWQAPTAVCCRKDAKGFAIEPVDPGVAAVPFQFAAGPGTQINLNNYTIAVSWVQRYAGAFSLLGTGGGAWGVTASAGLTVLINGIENSLFSTTMGARHSLVVSGSSTGVTAQWMTNGAMAGSITIPTTITSGHPAFDNIELGHFQSVMYGSIQEGVIVNRAVTATEAAQLLAYVDSMPAPDAFPVSVPALLMAGDSNVVGVQTSQFDSYKFYIVRALRNTYNLEMIQAGIVGASAGTDYTSILAPFYSAARAKHVCIFAAGANDIASNATGAATLAVAFAQMDQLRAIGGGGRVKLIACALPDRNGLFQGGQTHAGYRTQKAIFDAGIAASVGTHCNAYADWNTVPEVAADGAADNSTYFSTDKVHIAGPGNIKLQALMLAAAQAQLA